MNRKTVVSALCAAGGMMALILDGQTALTGAAEGIQLCIRTVVPSLFPFLFLCGILTNALWGDRSALLRPVAVLTGIPEGAESLLIAGFLGGYPAGAQAIGEAYRTGRLKKEDTAHLLSFCSNAGPAFLFGITARQFPSADMVWAMWCIQILSATAVGMMGNHKTSVDAALPPRDSSISAVLTSSVKTMSIICGWIILFRILLAFLTRWFLWLLPAEMQVFIAGLLELSNGCCMLSSIEHIPLRFLICCIMLSFGGLCVTMQTASVISGLPLTPYLRGKLIQSGFSALLALLFLYAGWTSLLIAGSVILIFPGIMKKRGRFPGLSGV